MVVGQNRYPIDADDYITDLQSPVPVSQAPREDVFNLQKVARPVPSNDGEAKARGGLGEAGGDGLSLQLSLQLLLQWVGGALVGGVRPVQVVREASLRPLGSSLSLSLLLQGCSSLHAGGGLEGRGGSPPLPVGRHACPSTGQLGSSILALCFMHWVFVLRRAVDVAEGEEARYMNAQSACPKHTQ